MRKIILTIILFIASISFINAQSWSPLGSGIGYPFNIGLVSSSVVYNGELYAGGYFYTASDIPANNIAKWNGTNWSNVGVGTSADVLSLCVFNGELYVGGYFSTAGDIAAIGIAKWNGSNWSNVGNVEAFVKTMAVYNGELYAAGWFSNLNSTGSSIAKWNGNSWMAVGIENDLYNTSIESMAVYNGKLYAAGAYSQIGGGGLPEFYRITSWDGTGWNNLLTIPASYTLDGALGNILSMKVYNGELYIAGNFSSVDTITASQIAKWNGLNWSAVGTGINFESYPYGFDGAYYTFVKTLEVYNGSLFATGLFTHCGTKQTQSIAKWDGNSWSNLGLGLSGYGYTMTGTDTALFVGGVFNYVNGYDGLYANNIAAWKDPCTAAPLQPEIIHGNTCVCKNTQQTFFVSEILGNTNYTWTLPSGWTGSSNTNSITTTIGTTGGIISVTANNTCGTSIAQTLDVSILPNSLPVIQSTITGNNLVCYGTAQTFFINNVPDATGYTWSLPHEWTGTSTDTSITVFAGETGGIISVTADNSCGSSIPKLITVIPNFVPQLPEEIYGNLIVCKGNIQTYSIQPVPQAIDYTWILPSGWTGNSTASYITTTVGNDGGNVLVAASNSCGSSSYQTMVISIDSIPSKPEDITGNLFTNTYSWNYYSIKPVNGAISYNWKGVDGIIQGQNSNSISVIWKKADTFELSVQAVSKCGMSPDQKITIIVSDYNTDDPFDLQIFPNPSNGEFYLKAKRVQDKMINVEVLNMAGQLVFNSVKKQGANDYSQLINLNKMPQGIYAVKIMVDDKVYVRSIVINN